MIHLTYNNISGYDCAKCTLYNDILRRYCWNCGKPRPSDIELPAQHAEFIRMHPNRREILKGLTMDDKQALHFQYYNDTTNQCLKMSDEQLEEFIKKIEAIHFESLPTLLAAKAERTRRNAQLKSQLTDADSSFDSEGALNTIKERKKRISKKEKLAKEMQSLLGIAGAAKIWAEIDQTKFNPNAQTLAERTNNLKPIAELCRIERHSECMGAFQIDGETKDCTCSCHLKKDLDDFFNLDKK